MILSEAADARKIDDMRRNFHIQNKGVVCISERMVACSFYMVLRVFSKYIFCGGFVYIKKVIYMYSDRHDFCSKLR